MDTNRETVIERLLSGYRRYYNVTRFDGGYNPPPEEFKGTRKQSSIFSFATTSFGQPIRKSLSLCFPFRF